jgi:hypothetical protein
MTRAAQRAGVAAEPPATPAAALATPGGGRQTVAAGTASAERLGPRTWGLLSPSIGAWCSAGRGRGSLAGPLGHVPAAGAAALSPAPAAAAAAAASGAQPAGEGAEGEGARQRRRPRDGRALAKASAALAAAATGGRKGARREPSAPPAPPPATPARAGAASGRAAAAVGTGLVAAPGAPARGDALDPALWAEFVAALAAGECSSGPRKRAAAARGPKFLEVSNLLVVPPEVSYRSKAQKDVRKRVGGWYGHARDFQGNCGGGGACHCQAPLPALPLRAGLPAARPGVPK